MDTKAERPLLATYPNGASKWISQFDVPKAQAAGAVVTTVKAVGDAWRWDAGGLCSTKKD